MAKCAISNFAGIKTEDNAEIISSIDTASDYEEAKLLLYLIWVTRCEMKDLDNVLAAGKGHYICDVEMPNLEMLI